jgi:hypothetical protein
MSRSKLKFRQGDVTRAIKAARAAGMEIGRVEITPDGNVRVFPSGGNDPELADDARHSKRLLRAGAQYVPPEQADEVEYIVNERTAAMLLGISREALRERAARGQPPERVQLSPHRFGYRLADCKPETNRPEHSS